MTDYVSQPAFGTADLTNCEREMIHLAGSIQPHGVFFVLQEPGFVIRQVSVNVSALFGRSADELLETALDTWSEQLAEALRDLLAHDRLERPAPLRWRIVSGGAAQEIEAMVHRVPNQGLVLELEAIDPQVVTTTWPSCPDASTRSSPRSPLRRRVNRCAT